MKNTLKKARRVRCISCGKWCASARYKNHPHGSNIYDWAKGGTIHGNWTIYLEDGTRNGQPNTKIQMVVGRYHRFGKLKKVLNQIKVKS